MVDFYEITDHAVQSLINDNNVELSLCGYGLYRRGDILNVLIVPEEQLESLKGKVIALRKNEINSHSESWIAHLPSLSNLSYWKR